MHVRTFAFLAGLLIASPSLFSQSAQTLTGVVSDSMCGTKHMMKGATAAECTRKCVALGSEYALVSSGKVYTLKGDTKQIDKYAGQSVTVTGNLSGNTVTVKSILPAKS